MRIECRRREKERGVWRDCNVSVWITRARQSWISHGGVSVGYVRRAHKDSNEERMRKRGKRPATSARMLFAPFFLLCIIGKRPSEKESIVRLRRPTWLKGHANGEVQEKCRVQV